ncbi:MAG: adenosylcobinamide-GDP ribazoletransferase, partial [Nitrososphaera sp.]
MAFLRPVQSVLGFLTILPAGKGDDIRYVASNMFLFPVVGIVIGAIVGAMAFGISPFLHPLIIGLLVAGALVIITGVHHTDALADFADGVMAKGDRESKRKAMDDPAVGSAGVAALAMYFAGMVVVFHAGSFQGYGILLAIITAEVIAKYVMVLLAHRGVSAWEGFSSPFTAAMKDRRKVLAASGIMLVTVWFAGGYAGLIALGVSLGIAALIKYVSGKSFGGISGDVLGATNE